MSVEPLRAVLIQRLEDALEKHTEEDRVQFEAIRHDQAELHGSMEVLKSNQNALLQRIGILPDPETGKSRKALATMGEGRMMWTVIGAMGGLLALDKIIVTGVPFLMAFLRELAKVH